MNISDYKISIRFDIARKEWTRLNTQLKLLERRLSRFNTDFSKKFSIKLDRFDVDQRRLNTSLGAALDIASRTTVFNIERFNVDQQALNRAISRATARASSSAHVRPDVHGTGGGRALGGRHLAGAGAVGGLAARAYLPALALAGGGYGLAQANRRNQEVVSAQLQSQAVVMQAGGTAREGTQSFDYLKSEANRIGFNYLDASPDYNKLLSGLTGSGVGLEESQKVFSGFAEIARTNKLDKTTQNRLFRALSQVAGKGKLQAEELTGQISEALPGGTALFARAYQAQKGGNLTGQAAIIDLMENMKKGKVNSGILTYAAADASRQANAGGALTQASKASQAQQQRFQNSVSDTAIIASQNGLESGFARLFKTLSIGLTESNGMAVSLARSFDFSTIQLEKLLLFPQSFTRALEGRDSLVADWLGIGATEKLREDWEQIRKALSDISSISMPSWMPSFESTAKEVAAIMGAFAKFSSTTSAIGQDQDERALIMSQIYQDEVDKGSVNSFGGTTIGAAKGAVKAGWYWWKEGLFDSSENDRAEYWMGRNESNSFDSPAAYRDYAQQRNQVTARDVLGNQGYGISQPVSANAPSTLDIKMNVDISAANVQDFDDRWQEKFKDSIGRTLLEFSHGE